MGFKRNRVTLQKNNLYTDLETIYDETVIILDQKLREPIPQQMCKECLNNQSIPMLKIV